MTISVQLDWFGDRAILVTCTDRQERAGLAALLARTFPDAVVRSGMRTVLVECPAPIPSLRDRVASAVSDGDDGRSTLAPAPRTVDLAVHYDGPDLGAAAAALGLAGAVLAERHAEQSWRVAMMGFAPGFGYLVPEGEWRADWAALARRDDPRSAVPAGSVAIAAGMSAVYPARMPGGWHLIGRTDAIVFDVDRVAPALLAPDDIVRFRDADR